MTESLLIFYSAAATVVVLLLLTAMLLERFRMRRVESRDIILRGRYLHVVMLSLYAGDQEAPRFPMIDRLGARLLLAETLAGVRGATYGLDPLPLQRIVAAYKLDHWLLHRIRLSQGYRRARYLALFAALPEDAAMVARIDRYASSRNRSVRFQALMAQLSADSSMALRLISDYGALFSGCEVAEIMTLLRRGMLPIAYEPLLCSPSRNLRLVGLNVVRQFGIEEAEPLLLRMIASDESSELGREALYTLCSLHRPISRREVAARVATMDISERKALLRYMAREGYAPEAARRIFDKHEYPYYESLVQSYKRCLV